MEGGKRVVVPGLLEPGDGADRAALTENAGAAVAERIWRRGPLETEVRSAGT